MTGVTNYHQQLREKLQEKGIQISTLSAADAATLCREVGKVLTVAGLVGSVVNRVFSLETKTPIALVVVSGTAWLVGGVYANHVEAEAKEMVKRIKEM